ncbi:16S rRNA (uracil(1498)-N(3))-methyltransferase [Paenibacillus pasadenensis]|uniref:16S rRNA (uracil(1498)-N(3))-methyltransferase n=1 Tax=Paenibacillus pasadenensis TaxID=217090 RepID=UPI0004281F42|nr:16S rRNA (uracil(1498)-N(3))-methyltransferase [Paenibacillus pasadenensis]
MQRYFVSPEQFGDSTVVLRGEDAHHMVKVMRMKAGDEVIVADGVSLEARVVLRELSASEVTADITERLPMDREPLWRVTVAQGLPKGDKMELVIQKGTELGAFAFLPFQSERMVVQYDARKEAKRLERWGKIAKEAAEQAHRSRLPEVREVHGWKQLLADVPRHDLALFCYEEEGHAPGALTGLGDRIRQARESGVLKDGEPHAVLLVVGPEGGFSPREAEEIQAAGALAAGLGRRILRAETAGLAGLAALMYESGEMGGRGTSCHR